MAEYSGFFDANIVNHEYDRVYLAEHFAKYFSNFIGNGVFGGKSDELIVLQNEQPDMSVRVMSGFGYINGYFYENDDELFLPIDVADGVLSRIDTIVLRWSIADRAIHTVVKKGVAASIPVAPSVERNNDFYELQLAQIYVRAGASSIAQTNITDKRLDSNVCGFVVAAIDHFDTAEFGLQLEAWMNEFKIASIAEVESLLSQLQEIIAQGDIGPLINDVNNLKAQSIESTEYPGCYYRVVHGETEWINPPNEYGVEYRLTERWKGRPVFKETIFVPSLPSNSHAYIEINAYFEEAISVSGHAFFHDDAASYPFPVHMGVSATPTAFIHRVENSPVGQEYKGSIGIQTTTESMVDLSAEITVKYVKYGI
ncbi:MAG: hypothetical protein IKK92_01995 [Prevotella sp.]|nr:hypothetical protein [Prevotella sp.]